MRPCPTCDCFVPVTARRCPRCEAALEPVCEEVGTHRDNRDPVLVGTNGRTGQQNGSVHTEPVGPARPTSVVARLTLPPLDGPAFRPRRASLPKLPQPYAPDPLVLAVFLGIPPLAPAAPPEPAREAAPSPDPPARSVDTFAALLGVPPATAPSDDRRPTAAPRPAPVPVAVPVAVPLAISTVQASTPRASSGRRRVSRADPFGRSTTRRERVLARLCVSLAIALALVVLVLRLPLGARPELGASTGIGNAVTSSPFDDAIRAQTHADFQSVITAAQQLDLAWRTYGLATPTLLSRALPQFGFVESTALSQRVGEMSVATSAHVLVLAEYGGPGECAFARVVDQQPATTVGLTKATCTASAAPTQGWTALSS